MDVRKVRRYVSLELRRAEVEVPTEHIAYVLIILANGHLLRDFDCTPEEYQARVQEAMREAFDRVISRKA
jgi:hypothetical protein